MIAAGPMQGESGAVARNEGLSRRAWGTLWGTESADCGNAAGCAYTFNPDPTPDLPQDRW